MLLLSRHERAVKANVWSGSNEQLSKCFYENESFYAKMKCERETCSVLLVAASSVDLIREYRTGDGDSPIASPWFPLNELR
jgi:hypothetical protein